MKNFKITFLLIFCTIISLSAQDKKEEAKEYKKKVLETVEVDLLMSYYTQDGNNAAVTGGIGTEELTDYTPTIVVKIPLNTDDVLTVDVGISAYSSASSSNLNPFDGTGSGDEGINVTGASQKGGIGSQKEGSGSPWVESSGASRQDIWGGITAKYSHSSDDRNTVLGADISFSSEYDYSSIGFGGSITRLFNEKNTEIGLSAQVYLDTWNPKYPTELDSYLQAGSNLNNGFFANQDILDQNGNNIDKDETDIWTPHQSSLVTDKGRNTYSASLSFSQILSKNAQFSLFLDIVKQQGWLANPMQRVYFADKANYYIGNPASIPNYTLPTNIDVFQLADDIERLPSSRLKIPIGARFNYFLNENFTIRTYYRYYYDDWGITGHTASIEFPIKFSLGKFTLYPNYRYYTQTAADYFAPYETHISTSEYYTSDYDLSKFSSHQYGIGFKYTDIFANLEVFNFGLKSIDVRYSYYDRSTGLSTNIITTGFKFVMD